MEIAEQLGVKVLQNDALETVIYDILDKAAIESAANSTVSAKRKRTRISKKDTDHVYSVSGKEGENLDSKPAKGKKVEAPSLFNDVPVEVKENQVKEEPAQKEEPEQPKKRRGRKSKAELAAIAAAEAAKVEAEKEVEVNLKMDV